MSGERGQSSSSRTSNFMNLPGVVVGVEGEVGVVGSEPTMEKLVQNSTRYTIVKVVEPI